MSNNPNGTLPGNTPAEIAIAQYAKSLDRLINSGRIADVSRGSPYTPISQSLASFSPQSGTAVVTRSKTAPISQGYLSFLTTVPVTPSQSGLYSIANNSDSYLYLHPDQADAALTFNNPSTVIPPYTRVVVGLSISQAMTFLAYVPHFDTTSLRNSYTGQLNADPNVLNSQRVSVYAASPNDAGVYQPLARGFTRIYDTLDFTTDNGGMLTIAGGGLYVSSMMNFDGFTDITAQIYCGTLGAANATAQLAVVDEGIGGAIIVGTTTITSAGYIVVLSNGVRSRLWSLLLSVAAGMGTATFNDVNVSGRQD